ncbi:hypothetical protein MD535_19285 [Vibrio sp. ZSDZ65]|uniref:Uncharacterized protein n=1 Tax=Vibrio qingdaonensis TaxID=2829491 RepID=A0A9X3CRJ8_9VIBR|nr:hypothetical protein [Vibrio qingdaonensis]MCW8348138.1 hypothetical protein [Vibrio qingdaonensis]
MAIANGGKIRKNLFNKNSEGLSFKETCATTKPLIRKNIATQKKPKFCTIPKGCIRKRDTDSETTDCE